jgi:hypothetical protein
VKKALVGLVVLLVAGAFVAGYWPQRGRLGKARREAAELGRQLSESRSALAAAEAKVRLGRILGQCLALRDAVEAGNFGEARTLSSPFFDAVREEATKEPDASARAALERVLGRRDTVTAGLARGEASVRETLVPIERDLRRALGYPAPPLAPAPVASEGASPRP